jgi:hypothetical protein
MDTSEWIKLEVLIDLDTPSSKYSKQFAIFKDGCPVQWIKWVMAIREIEYLKPLNELANKTRMIQTLLKCHSLSYFEHHLRSWLEVLYVEKTIAIYDLFLNISRIGSCMSNRDLT